MERGGESFVSEAVLGEFEGRLRTVLGDVVQGLEVQYQSISKKLAEKGEAISALEGKFSQFTVLEAPEAAMMGNGRIFCITCTTNMAALRDSRQLNSKFLAINIRRAQQEVKPNCMPGVWRRRCPASKEEGRLRVAKERD